VKNGTHDDTKGIQITRNKGIKAILSADDQAIRAELQKS
jgi:hypothetical protein